MGQTQKGQQRHAAGRASTSDIEKELARLSALNLDQLRREWKLKFSADPPPVRSRNILYRLIAWQIQADAFGGLDRKTERLLQSIAERLERDGTYEPKVRRGLSNWRANGKASSTR